MEPIHEWQLELKTNQATKRHIYLIKLKLLLPLVGSDLSHIVLTARAKQRCKQRERRRGGSWDRGMAIAEESARRFCGGRGASWRTIWAVSAAEGMWRKKGREGNNWRCGWGGVGMVRLNWEAGIRRCTFHFGRIMMVLREVNNTDIFRPYSNSM